MSKSFDNTGDKEDLGHTSTDVTSNVFRSKTLINTSRKDKKGKSNVSPPKSEDNLKFVTTQLSAILDLLGENSRKLEVMGLKVDGMCARLALIEKGLTVTDVAPSQKPQPMSGITFMGPRNM